MLAGNGRRLGSTNRTSPGILSSFQPDGGRSVEPAAGPSIVDWKQNSRRLEM